MSWVPEILAEGRWTPNGMRFATKEEAERWGAALLQRWTVAEDNRAVESADPVNYSLDAEGVLAPVKP